MRILFIFCRIRLCQGESEVKVRILSDTFRGVKAEPRVGLELPIDLEAGPMFLGLWLPYSGGLGGFHADGAQDQVGKRANEPG